MSKKNLNSYIDYNIEIVRVNDIILPALKINLSKKKRKHIKTAHVNIKVKELIGIENSLTKMPENLVYNEIIDFVEKFPEKCLVENVTFSENS